MWVGTREEFEALRARAETPADLLRMAREAAAEQERDGVAELAGWSFLDVTRAALQAKRAAEAIGCAPADLLRDVKGLVEQRDDERKLAETWREEANRTLDDERARSRRYREKQGAAERERDAAIARAEEAEREIRRRNDDYATIHTMLDDVGIGSGPPVERVRQLVDAWRLLSSTHNATIQEAVEGRAAAEAKLEALEDCNRAQMEIILDYLEAAGLPRDVDGDARAGLREISRLVALANAVREIVGGPADAETLRAKFEETSGDIPRMLSAWLGFEVKRVSCSGDGWAALATALDEPRHGLVVDRLEQRSDSFGGERSSLADLQVVRPLKISG